MIEAMNEKANKVIHGDFVAEVVKVGEDFLVSVKHFNTDQDPCAGQNKVVTELYKVLEACDLDKVGTFLHSGGFASVKAKSQPKVFFGIANYDVEMTLSQSKRFNKGDLNLWDEQEILVSIPIPVNHYKVVKFCDLDEETKSFMEDFEAISKGTTVNA